MTNPLVWILATGLIAWLTHRRFRLWSKVFMALAAATVVVTLPPIAYGLAVLWEGPYRGVLPCQSRAPDAIVVLPGGVRGPADQGVAGLTLSSVVRLEGALAAAERSEFPPIIVPGTVDEMTRLNEAALTRRGVASEIVYLPGADDTDDAAREVADSGLIQSEHVWLVTSALHMRRSVRSFEHYGIEVCPYAVDRTDEWVGALPDYRSVRRADAFLHEFVGLIYYELRFAFSGQPVRGTPSGPGFGG
ncbi:MAG: YdcF family protein [Pseudomonadota bacterium]